MMATLHLARRNTSGVATDITQCGLDRFEENRVLPAEADTWLLCEQCFQTPQPLTVQRTRK